MQNDARLTGDAATLAREHQALLDRLPATVAAFVLVELQKWRELFPPEQRYQRVLLDRLTRLPRAELDEATGGITRVEAEAGIHKLRRGDPGRLQDEAQALLRKQRLVTRWRQEVDGFFQRIDPALEAELYPADAPRRLVLQLYGSGIAVQPQTLWSRFKGTGLRIPLAVDASRAPDAFLRSLFGGRTPGSGAPLFAGLPNDARDVWLIESNEALQELASGARTSGAGATADRGVAPETAAATVGISYDRLRPYRDELTRALYKKILAGVESPQAFAAYARSLRISPGRDALSDDSDVLQAFIRDVFLTGNGTLFVNNTFVEWAAVQALRRAQPRVLVTRFGVRDRLKPFSSLLLFSQPRPSDQIPMIEDPVGSFVDVEQLSYYVWLNAEKSPAYRNRTLYLFLAEGVDELLAVRSDVPLEGSAALSRSSLSDVHATMAQWLGLPSAAGTGRPIEAIVR